MLKCHIYFNGKKNTAHKHSQAEVDTDISKELLVWRKPLAVLIFLQLSLHRQETICTLSIP